MKRTTSAIQFLTSTPKKRETDGPITDQPYYLVLPILKNAGILPFTVPEQAIKSQLLKHGNCYAIALKPPGEVIDLRKLEMRLFYYVDGEYGTSSLALQFLTGSVKLDEKDLTFDDLKEQFAKKNVVPLFSNNYKVVFPSVRKKKKPATKKKSVPKPSLLSRIPIKRTIVLLTLTYLSYRYRRQVWSLAKWGLHSLRRRFRTWRHSS